MYEKCVFVYISSNLVDCLENTVEYLEKVNALSDLCV